MVITMERHWLPYSWCFRIIVPPISMVHRRRSTMCYGLMSRHRQCELVRLKFSAEGLTQNILLFVVAEVGEDFL